MMRIMHTLAVAAICGTFLWTQSVLASPSAKWWQGHPDAIVCQGVENCTPCAGAALVVEEADPETGTPILVRLGEYTARRDGTTVIVQRDGVDILSLDASDAVLTMSEFPDLVANLKLMTDICRFDTKSFNTFESLASAILVPKLVELGLPSDALRQGGYAGGFVLILVLFILLVIVGAGFGEGG
jgi:uncharacterized protein (TIGR01732 family)